MGMVCLVWVPVVGWYNTGFRCVWVVLVCGGFGLRWFERVCEFVFGGSFLRDFGVLLSVWCGLPDVL